MTTREHSPLCLARDSRGAIMVAGVFMAALLSAALFTIIGTGDAIIYRERLQDAADAAAYTSAGVHARGMNLVVMINLVMAALLAVLVALRAVIAALGFALVICGAVSALGAGTLAGLCAPVTASGPALVASLEKAANSYEQALDVSLPALGKLGRVVAAATPYVALHKSTEVAEDYQPLVKRGFAASPSMAPGSKRLGLPVQEMDAGAFCKASAELGVSNALFWAPVWVEDAASKLAGGVVDAFGAQFCGSSLSGLGQSIGKSAAALCAEEKKACLAHQKAKFCTDLGDGTFDFDWAKCKKETKDDIKKALKASGTTTGYVPKGTPKEIWSGAQHGGLWFQTWGFALGEQSWPRRNDRGVAMAWAGGLPAPATQWGDFRVAQAELYCDRAASWSTLATECMWQMAWRARLRRVSLPSASLGGSTGGALFSKLDAALGSALTGLAPKGGIAGMLDPTVYKKAATTLELIDSQLPDKSGGTSAVTSWEIIH